MRARIVPFKSSLLCGLGLIWLALLIATDATASERLPAVRVAGAINPVVADFILAELDQANRAEAPAFLLELDTPGGLDTAMREIIQAILSSDLPVIVYIAPSGARAASA